ncbi:hypothetical protein HDV63DRAFT_413502 [Trichoderma sp. SZMC 28014]
MSPAAKRSGSTLRRWPKRHRPEASTPSEPEESDPSTHNKNTHEKEANEGQVWHTVSREEAQQVLRGIITPLREGIMPMASLASLVTRPHLMVLTRDDKMRIMVWAKFQKLEHITQWRIDIDSDIHKCYLRENRYVCAIDAEWKSIEKWLLENPTCAIIKDLCQLKEAMQHQASQLSEKDSILKDLMQKLEKMQATFNCATTYTS